MGGGGAGGGDGSEAFAAETLAIPEIVVTPTLNPGPDNGGWGTGPGGAGPGGSGWGDAPSFDAISSGGEGSQLGDVGNFGGFGFGWSGGFDNPAFSPFGANQSANFDTAAPATNFQGWSQGNSSDGFGNISGLSPGMVDSRMGVISLRGLNPNALRGEFGRSPTEALTQADDIFGPRGTPIARGPEVPDIFPELPPPPMPAARPSLAPQAPIQTAALQNVPNPPFDPRQSEIMGPVPGVPTPTPAPGVNPQAPSDRAPTQITVNARPSAEQQAGPQNPVTFQPATPPTGLESVLASRGATMQDFIGQNPDLIRPPLDAREFVGQAYHGLARSPQHFQDLNTQGIGPGDVAGRLQQGFTSIGLQANSTPEDANREFMIHYGMNVPDYANMLFGDYGLSGGNQPQGQQQFAGVNPIPPSHDPRFAPMEDQQQFPGVQPISPNMIPPNPGMGVADLNMISPTPPGQQIAPNPFYAGAQPDVRAILSNLLMRA
jgi:hypothetical protein